MSETLTPEDALPTTVKQDLVTLDRVFNKTNLSREEIAEKLGGAIKEMALSSDDPKLINAQMKVIDTYLSALDGQDGNVSRRVHSKLKQVETETSSKHSAAVADLLSKISIKSVSLNTGSRLPSPEEIDLAMEQAYEGAGLPPIMGTELKTDPKDLSS